MTTDDPKDDGFLERFLSSAFSVADSGSIVASDSDPAAAREPAVDEPIPQAVGRFTVVDVLGEGGSGRVLRARDPTLGRDVAVKVLRAALASDAAACERFVAEANVCAGLQHPGIVAIHEFGRLDDGRPFFAMKIVEGQTFAELMRGAARGAAARGFVEIFEKVCQTLAYVHAHGVLHGDLKPHNVMVGAFGEVQVMDFGFARHAGAQAASSGATPGRVRVGGTLAYMAPEQARGDDAAVSPRTDVFGLGAMLCEILTGVPPYRAATRAELLLKASKGWLDDAHSRLRSCDGERELVDLALRCLAFDPATRPADAGELAHAVSTHLRLLAQRARDAELEAEKARAVAAHEARSRRLTLALSVAVLIAVIVPSLLLVRAALERDVRRGTAEHAVGAAIERARLLAADARVAQHDAATPWAKAAEAAHAAVALALGPDVGPESRAIAVDVEAEIERERAAGAAKASVVARLADLRPHGRLEAPAQIDETYRATFASLGIDTNAPDAGATAERIRDDQARDTLIDGLDDWTWVRKAYKTPDAEAWRALSKLALAGDDDALRNQVRQALLDGAGDRLLQLAARDRLADESSRSLALLARWLAQSGARSEAIRVYRIASFRHPEDARLSHDLAGQLALLDDPPYDEITRLYSMALAVEPDDSHVLTDLGRVLLLRGERANAASMLEHSVALDPKNGRALMLLGAARTQLGQYEAALAPLSGAVEQGEFVAVVNLEDAFVRLGRVGESSVALRCVLSRHAAETDVAMHCAARWLQLRDFASCATVIAGVLAVQPNHAGALHVQAMLALEDGRFDDAVAIGTKLEAALTAGGASLSTADSNFIEYVVASRDAARDLDSVDASVFGRLPPQDAAFLANAAFRSRELELAARGFESALPRGLDAEGRMDFFPPGVIACARMSASAPESERARWRTVAFKLARQFVERLGENDESATTDARDALRALWVIESDPAFAAAVAAAGPGDSALAAWNAAVTDAKAELVRAAAAEKE